MGLCESCKNSSCGYASEDVIRCGDFEENLVQTNADRIRAMSDEELAVLINKGIWSCEDCQEYVCDKRCDEHCLEWLKQPVE